MKKTELRKQYFKIRNKLGDTQEKDLMIVENLKTIINDYKKIGIYFSINNEPNIMRLLNDKQMFYVPYCYKDKHLMEYRQLLFPTFLNKIIKDEAGISSTTQQSDNELDVIIAPSILANPKGYRLGYGGGYYDIFLKDKNCLKIICTYDDLVKAIDFEEEYDIKFDYIITENKIIKCK